MSAASIPDKLFFRIGEVARIVGVRPHVLRYWEEEFATLRPMKTRGSHRVYRRRDVELSMLIKRLLHDEGYTVPGARKKLRELSRGSDTSGANTIKSAASRETDLRADMLALREQLTCLLSYLDEFERPRAAPTPAKTTSEQRGQPQSAHVPIGASRSSETV